MVDATEAGGAGWCGWRCTEGGGPLCVDPGPEEKRAGEGGAPASGSARHEGSKYLMLRFRPELAATERRERRDWIFLFESSADRNPLLARVQVDVVKTILEKGLDQHPVAEQAFDALADSYTGQGRFCRNTRHLLKH